MENNELIAGLLALGVILIFLAIVGLIIYLYEALCLQFIAKKTNTPNGWLAWIPFANLFLMTRIAKMHWVWALILCIFFIGGGSTTDIGTWLTATFSIACAVVIIIIWVKICQAVNRPGWWTVLLLIPVVRWIMMGIMAFSKE